MTEISHALMRASEVAARPGLDNLLKASEFAAKSRRPVQVAAAAALLGVTVIVVWPKPRVYVETTPSVAAAAASKISETPTASEVAMTTAQTAAAEPLVLEPERRIAPPKPELEAVLRDAPIAALVAGEKPRVTIKGRSYGVGQEFLPKLFLKAIDGRTIFAEDADGALYLRTF